MFRPHPELLAPRSPGGTGVWDAQLGPGDRAGAGGENLEQKSQAGHRPDSVFMEGPVWCRDPYSTPR